MWRTIVQWILKQTGWRALLVRIGLLTALWSVVAFVFATEFFLSARTGPISIPWTAAAGSAFRDWFPWVLLSPAAIFLAGRFRFDRARWHHSMGIHLLACFCFGIAYQLLASLAYPGPLMVSSGGIQIVTATHGKPPHSVGFVGAVGSPSPPVLPLRTNSSAVQQERGYIVRFDPPPPSESMESNRVFVALRAGSSTLTQAGTAFATSVRAVGPPNPWLQFLELALLRMQFTVPIYLCIVCACWAMGHFQEANQHRNRSLELEARLTQANLQALKMQLQPHFLFNSLNAISSLVHECPKAADDMIGSLSQFLRTTLEISSANEVPLRRELTFLDHYLEIQQIRYGNRLRLCRDLELAQMEALVPPLLLQPLVENAIRFGIEPRESGGTVAIRAWREGQDLRLEVFDDGEGFKGGHLLGTGHGVGLSNTKARLQTLYGANHEFKMIANQPTGTSILIRIPFHLSPACVSNQP